MPVNESINGFNFIYFDFPTKPYFKRVSNYLKYDKYFERFKLFMIGCYLIFNYDFFFSKHLRDILSMVKPERIIC